MAIVHVKNITLADHTGTVTAWDGATTVTVIATDQFRPSDWNSNHNLAFTLTGNTTLGSTVSGTDIVFAGSGGIFVGGSAGTLIISAPPLVSLAPMFPNSTSTGTGGAFGGSTASAFMVPMIIEDPIAFNAIRFPFSASIVTTTNSSGAQTITSAFGLYSNNAGTLSQISSGSFSIALSLSSISGSMSFPTSTGTGGYGYGTSGWSSTATGQSLFGTAGIRGVDLQFGNTMLLGAGTYYLGLFQRQSTSNTNIGLSTGYVGNVFGSMTGIGAFGQSTLAFSNSSQWHLHPGVYTSTGSAGYGGTTLPTSVIPTGLNYSVAVHPLVTFMST